MSRPQHAAVLARSRLHPGHAPAQPPQGPPEPGESFDQWFLRGTLIEAEIERDRIHSARWDRQHGADPNAPSAYLAGAMIAQLRVRPIVDRLAELVAFGAETLPMAAAITARECPEIAEENVGLLRERVDDLRWAADVQARRIRAAIWPMCKRREPGLRIFAAAEAIPGPMPRRHVLELCRDIAAASQRKRRVHA